MEPYQPNPTEQLDEDQLAVDPLEAGVDPPERWSSPDDNETLDERLAAEEPDQRPEPPAPEVLDESVDDELQEEWEDPPPARTASDRLTEAERRGQAADVAGGSVAEGYRSDS